MRSGTSTTPRVPTGILDHDRRVADADVVDGDGRLRALAVGFLLLFLDQPGDRPRVSVAPEIHDRPVQPDVVDRQPAA